MKFKLQLAGYIYSTKNSEFLKTKGFKFTDPIEGYCKVDISKHLDADTLEVEINTLEELLALLQYDTSREKCQELIVSNDTIIIYDDYVE